MSGHSKWATTKHKKAVVDAKRSKLFAKLIKNVEVVATVASGTAAGRIVAVRQRHLLATSFHPEVTGDDRLHRYFADIVRERGA